MPGGTALEVIENLEGSLNNLPIVLITSAYDPDVAQKAAELGVKTVLSKPVEMEDLNRLIEEYVTI